MSADVEWIVKASMRDGTTSIEAQCRVSALTREVAHRKAWEEFWRVFGLRPRSWLDWETKSEHASPDVSGGF